MRAHNLLATSYMYKTGELGLEVEIQRSCLSSHLYSGGDNMEEGVEHEWL